MNKNRFYLFLIIALSVSNLILVGIIITQKGAHFHPDKPRNKIIEKLHFNANQIEAYDQLIKKHRVGIEQKDNEIREIKNELYKNLVKDEEPMLLDSLTNKISFLQKQIEENHYHHFLEIKALCNGEQETDFKELVKELGQIFSHKPPKKK